jgi:hypothetical protein
VISSRLHAWMPVALVAAALAGCSNSPPPPPPPPAATTPATPSPTPTPTINDEPAVRATFEAYRQALLLRDGKAAAALLSNETVNYYRGIAELAGTGGPDQIKARPLVDRLTIVMLRVLRPPAELAAQDGRALFQYAVEVGLVDSTSIKDNALGRVRITGDLALAQVVVAGQPLPVDYAFVRSGVDWKLNTVPILPTVSDDMKQAATQAKLSEDDFIFRTVEAATGLKIDGRIYEKP